MCMCMDGYTFAYFHFVKPLGSPCGLLSDSSTLRKELSLVAHPLTDPKKPGKLVQHWNLKRRARPEPPSTDLRGKEPEAKHRLSPGNWAKVLAGVRTREEQGLRTGSDPGNSHRQAEGDLGVPRQCVI